MSTFESVHPIYIQEIKIPETILRTCLQRCRWCTYTHSYI